MSCSSVGEKMKYVQVEGKVIDANTGTPIPELKIEAYHFPKWNSYISEYKPFISVITDIDGKFKFEVKAGMSIEIISRVSESEKIGSLYRISEIREGHQDVVLKHASSSIGLLKEPDVILKK